MSAARDHVAPRPDGAGSRMTCAGRRTLSPGASARRARATRLWYPACRTGRTSGRAGRTVCVAGMIPRPPGLIRLAQGRARLSPSCRVEWCRRRDLNPRPTHYECVALPAELLRRLQPPFRRSRHAAQGCRSLGASPSRQARARVRRSCASAGRTPSAPSARRPDRPSASPCGPFRPERDSVRPDRARSPARIRAEAPSRDALRGR